MALESLPKISPANFSPDNDLIQVYSKKGDYVGVINPSYIKGSPSGVAGAIQFSDGSAFASDSANLFWDNVNKRLGVGTNAPTGRLQVVTDDATNPQAFSNQTSILAGTLTQGLLAAYSSTNGAYLNALSPGIAWYKINYGALQHIFSNAGNVNAVIDSNTTFGAGTSSLGARVGIKGSGSTSATTSLLVQNSAGNDRLRVYDDGTIFMGNTNPGIYTTFGYSGRIGNNIFESPSAIFRYGGGQLTFYGTNNNANAFSFEHNNQQASLSTGISMINLGGTYQNQQNFEFANLRIAPTYDFNANTTTAAIARGIYYNPTITNLRVAQHYAWQNTSGAMIVNSSTPNASAILQADSTTQGFLPPRMTDAQIRAIVSPANGLVAYNTDINHLCCYQNGAWAKFSHSPM